MNKEIALSIITSTSLIKKEAMGKVVLNRIKGKVYCVYADAIILSSIIGSKLYSSPHMPLYSYINDYVLPTVGILLEKNNHEFILMEQVN